MGVSVRRCLVRDHVGRGAVAESLAVVCPCACASVRLCALVCLRLCLCLPCPVPFSFLWLAYVSRLAHGLRVTASCFLPVPKRQKRSVPATGRLFL